MYTPVDERDEPCASLCYCVIAINGFIFYLSFLLVCEYREYISCDFLSRFIICGYSVFFFFCSSVLLDNTFCFLFFFKPLLSIIYYVLLIVSWAGLGWAGLGWLCFLLALFTICAFFFHSLYVSKI